SYQFGKDALERLIYEKVINNQKLMGCKYNELSSTLRIIKEKRKGELYFKRLKMFQGNPIIAHIKDDLSVHTIGQVNSFITKLANSSKIVPYNFAAYPNARQELAFYLENGLENGHLRPVIKFIARVERKKVSEIEKNFKIAMMAIRRYVEEYSLLESVLDKKGFAMTLEGVLNGNATLLKLLSDALTNYVVVRDMNINLRTMTELDMTILNLAYNIEKTSQKGFLEVISKILPARIYHELVKGEERYKQRLSKIMDFENVKDRIISLKAEQRETVKQICLDMFKKSYITKYNSDGENKNFLYQIGKPQNLWSIRKLMDVYGDLMLELFPCWLLSPENVSTIMPLREGMFDLILFDEASQIFIESTLPTIYRGKHIVIAGDNKQLRPSAHFMRRYMGSDIDELDLNTQAALEVESLLDLATSRYNGINLNYHYRSAHEEFINFSNHAFYDCRLQIAPNLSRNIAVKPIERIKVEGRWIDRKNKTEAQQVVNLIKKLFKTRKNNESIGVITFNAEQEQYIKDLIDAEMKQNVSVNNQFLSEFNRKEHGEDISLFIKNIENVQGDERDIIIFCIGYAKNEQGKVLAHFGPLNMEGGENRLNVAITRAKKKIYVVTSIEPDELMVENTKNQGPKLFKKYLQYVQAVSSGNKKQADIILEGFRTQNQVARPSSAGIANGIKEALEKQGWTVEADLGNAGYKLSLAIYDKQLDRYLVGIECDDTAYHSSSSILERDVFRSKFMESRGWNILRIWSRDWWLNPTKVINQITKEAKRSRDKMMSK
ncbi:MAG: AAA domain-containing protein, partial [Firmicutes bacterium]|nr:AAA domain-containing protein [Bacillota bacterium]